tara:strand:+ start:278 stop:931 length:654 start_codon:yes stop_codon:yes gene_type:complete
LRKREREKEWNKDKVEIIKELNTLIQSRIEIEDIFTPLHSLHNHNPRPRTNHPLQPNLRPIVDWIGESTYEIGESTYELPFWMTGSKQIRPLLRGKFYLTHDGKWGHWNSMPNYKYAGALDIIYILTKEEAKNYRRAKPLVTPREEPEKEIIAMKWPAFWATYTYFPAPTLLICTHVHHATGWGVTVAVNESEFVKKFKQLIPIGDAKIIALNYPNL